MGLQGPAAAAPNDDDDLPVNAVVGLDNAGLPVAARQVVAVVHPLESRPGREN